MTDFDAIFANARKWVDMNRVSGVADQGLPNEKEWEAMTAAQKKQAKIKMLQIQKSALEDFESKTGQTLTSAKDEITTEMNKLSIDVGGL